MRIFLGKHSVGLPIWAGLQPSTRERSALGRSPLFLGVFVLFAACGGMDRPDQHSTDAIGDGTSAIVTGACSSCDGDCITLSATITDRHHTDEHVTYSEQPPVGGPHNACWLPWAIYASEQRTERWVHNLEHGGLAFLYNCPDSCDTDVATLTAFVDGLPQGRGIMLPYAEMQARFAVVAWGVSLTMGCIDTDALLAFYAAHADHSPEDTIADPPSSCPPPLL